jgi:hypothetical protein
MNISMAEEISQQNSDLEIIRHRVREMEHLKTYITIRQVMLLPMP